MMASSSHQASYRLPSTGIVWPEILKLYAFARQKVHAGKQLAYKMCIFGKIRFFTMEKKCYELLHFCQFVKIIVDTLVNV